jgi:RimJ/RimL family protein N-acetyltransferase
VVRRDDGRGLGYVQAGVAEGVATLAYLLAVAAQRQGYAREAVGAVIGHLTAQGVARFRACVDTRNARSIALLEALGFACAVVRPGAEVIHGLVTDEAEYQRSR